MTSELSREDETYKYIFKKLGVRFYRRLGYDAESIKFKNVELVPLAPDNRYMDIFIEVDGKYNSNVELQSSPVYDSKMEDMYKYRIYSQSEDGMPFKTCVFATYNPKHGIDNLEIDGDINFHPDFYYVINQSAEEVLNVIVHKVNNRIPLLDTEAIDLIILPDMKHDLDIKKLLERSSGLLVNAVIEDADFHLDLIECQKKMLQRFLEVADRSEVEKMLKFKAEDYGIEPNVTGIEEEINLAYLDGEREGKLSIVRNLIKLGSDDEFISKVTGLDLDKIRALR